MALACKRTSSALSIFLGVSLAGAVAVRAEVPRLTLHVLGTQEVQATAIAMARITPTQSREVHLLEQQHWFGVDLDLRLVPLFSLDLGASQGSLKEIRFDSSQGVTDTSTGSAPLRHLTLSALYHPIRASSGRRVDLYLGPSLGMAYYSRVFAKSESEPAYGGKLGFDVRLGESNWLFTGEASILKSRIQILPGASDSTLEYDRFFAVGLGYHW